MSQNWQEQARCWAQPGCYMCFALARVKGTPACVQFCGGDKRTPMAGFWERLALCGERSSAQERSLGMQSTEVLREETSRKGLLQKPRREVGLESADMCGCAWLSRAKPVLRQNPLGNRIVSRDTLRLSLRPPVGFTGPLLLSSEWRCV